MFRFRSLLSTIAIWLGIVTPALSADRIDFSLGLLEFPLSVAALETFAEKGEINPDLQLFLRPLSSKQREGLRRFLRSRYQVDPIVVSRMVYTKVGIELLTSVGDILQTPTRQNGFYAIRSAVILAAMDSAGITPIELLKQFPINMRVDLGKLLKLQKQVATLEKKTKKLIADNSVIRENNSPLKAKDMGNLAVTEKTLSLLDNRPDWQDKTLKTRIRKINLDLYLPETDRNSVSVIVVSNGLGAKRDRFNYLGRYLASHGFAVIIPDHPGSDRQRQKDFYQGLYSENFSATEFIDRPLDISFILDTLQQEPSFGLQNKLNFNSVGIFGYSFGGATALTLAGAEFDWERLQEKCPSTQKLLNISLLYQCRAVELPKQSLQLKDRRVKSIYLFVPFSSILFSRESMSNLTLPILWSASDRDLITPLLLEQLPAFRQLNRTNKYAVIFQNLPHTFVTHPKNNPVSIAQLKDITKSYHRNLSLAFFAWYLRNNSSYLPYLTSQGMQTWGKKGYEPILLH